MKKLGLLILPLLMMVFAATAKGDDHSSATGIQFKELSWAETAKLAAKNKKLVFIDVYTSWCGPCKMLRKNTFPDKALGDYFNANFVNIAIDAEKGEWIEFSRKYNVQAYPTMLILDKDGKEIGRTMGYMPAEQLLQFGKDTNKKK